MDTSKVPDPDAWRVVVWCTSWVFISGCAQVAPVTAPIQDVAAEVVLPVAEEEALGERMARELEREVRLHPSPQLQRYVERVGRAVVRSARDVPEGIDFRFRVIDDDEMVNAVTLPGGNVYVYSGLLEALDDEAELAGVLAHEVAHVSRRHVAERLATLYGLELVHQLALGAGGGALVQLVSQIAATGALLGFSRDQEREADVVGLAYLTRAGYDPMGLVRFFETLAAEAPEAPGALQFLQTHPAPAERLSRLEALIAARPENPERTARRQYQAVKRFI